jgi:hypothetical protein
MSLQAKARAELMSRLSSTAALPAHVSILTGGAITAMDDVLACNAFASAAMSL